LADAVVQSFNFFSVTAEEGGSIGTQNAKAFGIEAFEARGISLDAASHADERRQDVLHAADDWGTTVNAFLLLHEELGFVPGSG